MRWDENWKQKAPLECWVFSNDARFALAFYCGITISSSQDQQIPWNHFVSRWSIVWRIYSNVEWFMRVRDGFAVKSLWVGRNYIREKYTLRLFVWTPKNILIKFLLLIWKLLLYCFDFRKVQTRVLLQIETFGDVDTTFKAFVKNAFYRPHQLHSRLPKKTCFSLVMYGFNNLPWPSWLSIN